MATEPPADLWVFAYGSLMWRPGFLYDKRCRATLQGWRRRLCVWSHVYRGTPQAPGLVLGLDAGGACEGVAFHVEASERATTVRYLRERELVTDAYFERVLPVALETGARVAALTYVANVAHAQYAPPMTAERALAIINASRGLSGANTDYVRNTVAHLREVGIEDVELDALIEGLAL